MPHQPLAEITRAGQLESIHYGSIAVWSDNGGLIAGWGDPLWVCFLRSTAKPFQALPVVRAGVLERFGLNDRDLALMCASHSGTDQHAERAAAILERVGLDSEALACGMHSPYDARTARRIEGQDGEPSVLRHNCSGKHAGMLALAVLLGQPIASYLEPDGPVQRQVLASVAEITGLKQEAIVVGIDGCSAPNFAIPLASAAAGFGRLASAAGGGWEDRDLQRIYRAMVSHPELVAGAGRFDTQLMQVSGGRILAKGGAEGCLALAVPTGTGPDPSPALGIMIKVADGDGRGRAVPVVAVEVLRQLAILSEGELRQLSMYDRRPLANYRGLEVGEIRTSFQLATTEAREAHD